MLNSTIQQSILSTLSFDTKNKLLSQCDTWKKKYNVKLDPANLKAAFLLDNKTGNLFHYVMPFRKFGHIIIISTQQELQNRGVVLIFEIKARPRLDLLIDVEYAFAHKH